ncbi:hypothetical protein [Bacillus sp. JJ864]|uniref:hypothetical protein n=1 Tax=Bacillus sp. JJ864 TaxID=3122975 RepID=UPI003F68B50E
MPNRNSSPPYRWVLARHALEDGDEFRKYVKFTKKRREAAKICYEFLQPGSHLRCAVPDAFFSDEDYQAGVQVGGPGPLDHPAVSHKIVHNYKTMTSMFEEAGFEVKLLEYCDENGEFHYNDWNEKDGFIYRSKRFDHRN